MVEEKVDERKQGFVSETKYDKPVKTKDELAKTGEHFVVLAIRNANTKFGQMKVYETQDFVFFGGSVLDKALETDVIGHALSLVKIKRYYAFTEKISKA